MKKAILTGIALLSIAIPAWTQDTGWIGVRIEDQKERGAIVRNVEPNSPAAKAGLKDGDIIVEFNKEEVIGVQQFTRLVRETPVGRAVELKIRREGRDETVQLTTESAIRSGQILGFPDTSVLRDRVLRGIPRIEVNPSLQIHVNTSYVQSGVRVEQLTDQLRDFFGVFSNTGVLVSAVDQGSVSEKAGLKAGDVIISVDGRTVRTPGEFNREMRVGASTATARAVALKIVREKQERDITLELPAR